MLEVIRSKCPSGRYLMNIILAAVVIIIMVGVYHSQPMLYFAGRSLDSQECEVPKDKVLVDLDQIIKSPVSIAQDDPKLVQRIRDKYIVAPSKDPYNLASNNDDPSMGQSKRIREILGDLRDGFFIECGALDGETRSNTLGFEKLLNWKGILIEGDPKNIKMVISKNRKATVVPACLSTASYPNTVLFKQSYNLGKISGIVPGQGTVPGHAEVQCLPLYSILLAMNRTTVDYFSLDVEGNELEVLRTIPWNKVNIKTLSVEFIHGKEGKSTLQKFMESKGYVVHSQVLHPMGLANDFIFAKSELLSSPPKLKENN